jgi:hypothetical protein
MDCILSLPEVVLINLNTQVYLHYKVKVKLAFEQATKAQRESESVPLLFL